MNSTACKWCATFFLNRLRHCPHCGEPSLFPNVAHAGESKNRDALKARYETQIEKAKTGGYLCDVEKLETHLLSAQACKGMPGWEIHRLISSDSMIGATYYNQIQGKMRLPDDNKWDRLRRIADAYFFSNFGSDINFAALSINHNWLSNYGDGAIFFKDNMISHRATLFEENTAIWFEKNPNVDSVPKGTTAVWEDRHLLGVAKLAEKCCGAEPRDIVLKGGGTSSEDDFIEIHFLGEYTIRSIQHLAIRRNVLSELIRELLNDLAANHGLVVEECQ